MKNNPKYLRLPTLCERLGISKSTVWRWSGDPDNAFPKPIKLGPGTTVWKVEEIEEWEAANEQSCAA